MREPSVSEIKALRERSGASLLNCKRALIECDCDFLLAEGFLRYIDCAVSVKPPLTKEEWVMQRARKWKMDKLSQTRSPVR